MTGRVCAWCKGPIPARARRDSVTCSKRCRQARHRLMRYASPAAAGDASRVDARHHHKPSRLEAGLQARRLAYADPPYPGMAYIYRDHPDYGGEVDHAELLSRLAAFDGWALSTSAAALPAVLAEAVAQDLPVRVAAWLRGPRPHTTARYPRNAWEPVIYVPVPSRVAGDPRRIDALAHGVTPLLTLPSRVVGTKPPAFCRWIFDLVGATPADTLADLFPGSGVVSMTWQHFVAEHHASSAAAAAVAADR